MEALEMKNPARGGAGEFSELSNLHASYSENLGDWQRLGDVAADVVENLAHRRERWLTRRHRLAPALARVVAFEMFGGAR